MNSHDSERLSGLLQAMGFAPADSEAEANLVIFNTCSVRDHAEERVYGRMEALMARKAAGEDVLIAVTGCMAGRDKNGELRRRLAMADLFFPTADMVNLPRWIAELRPAWTISGDTAEDYLKIKPLRLKEHQAYVTIQTGCNNFCTYCVVPYARGLERNRPAGDILREIYELAERGTTDFTLLGQTVNRYRASDPGSFSAHNPYKNHFAALLWEINQMPGVARLHWTAAHPSAMTEEVIHALTLPKQVNYLHLPVQSGSDEVLRRMNRKYMREEYLETINRIKAARPGMALGTDIIVGFPGETEEDFQATVELYEACDFDISYTAQYSPRPGTLSLRLFTDDVAPRDKKLRWETLQDLMEKNTLRKNQEYLGRTTQVFIEKVEADAAYGTSPELKAVKIMEPMGLKPGQMTAVKMTKAMTWLLEGRMA